MKLRARTAAPLSSTTSTKTMMLLALTTSITTSTAFTITSPSLIRPRPQCHNLAISNVRLASAVAPTLPMDKTVSSSASINNNNVNSKGPPVMKLESEEQYRSLLQQVAASSDSATPTLLVLKVYSPVCKACQALAPKFTRLAASSKSNMIFAEIPLQPSTKVLIQDELGVDALPTIQFYQGGSTLEGEETRTKLVDSFACGPSKVAMLKRKLERWEQEQQDKQQEKNKFGHDSSTSTSSLSSSTKTPVVTSLKTSDYFNPDGDIPLQASDLFMMDYDDDDDEMDDQEENGVGASSTTTPLVITQRVTDYFNPDGDIPLQASDLFMMDYDDEEDEDGQDDDEVLAGEATAISFPSSLTSSRKEAIPVSEYFDPFGGGDIPLQASDLFLVDETLSDTMSTIIGMTL